MNTLGAIHYPNVPFKQLYIPHILKEIYIDQVYRTIFTDQKNMVTVDVGANIGLVTQFMRQYSKVVHAVEPEPANFEALSKNKQFNEWENVRLHNIALSDKDGIGNLAINTDNKTMHTLVVDPTHMENGRYVSDTMLKGKTVYIEGTSYDSAIPVVMKKFDTFFKDAEIDHVDFMKFDVEGAEEMILKSEAFKTVAPMIDAMLIEFHFDSWNELVVYIASLGYKVIKFHTDATILLFTRT